MKPLFIVTAVIEAATGLIAAMTLYNIAAVAVLAYTGVVSRLVGSGLWPGVVVHTAMAAWCIATVPQLLPKWRYGRHQTRG